MSTLYNNKYDILASTIQPNPTSVKYWADLSSNANGGDLKYFNGTKWVLVNNKATEDISQIKQQIADLEQNKEDKVEGKGLSTEDYTTQEKNKLSNIIDTDYLNDIGISFYSLSRLVPENVTYYNLKDGLNVITDMSIAGYYISQIKKQYHFFY